MNGVLLYINLRIMVKKSELDIYDFIFAIIYSLSIKYFLQEGSDASYLLFPNYFLLLTPLFLSSPEI